MPVIILLLGLLVSVPVQAQSPDISNLLERYAREAGPDKPPIVLGPESLLGAAPASLLNQQVGAQVTQQESQAAERPQYFDGSSYTIVAPIFLGINGNTSYIRYWNISSSTVPISTMVVGWPSGTVYGTAVVSVPSAAAPQYSIAEIMSAAGASSPMNGDKGVTLYLPHNGATVGFQHVIYNSTSLFFENVSLCQSNILASLNSYLMNVHTSILSAGGYPSVFYMHNFKGVSQNIKIFVLDARTGALRGAATYTIPPNDTGSVSVDQLEKDIGWTPGPNDFHYNLLFANAATNSVVSGLLLGQVIYNAGLSSYVNMSLYCDIK